MIKLKINELLPTFNVLKELTQSTGQPFLGQAKNLIYDIQHEITFLQKKELSDEDFKSISDKELSFGDFIIVPENYAVEFAPILEKLCGKLPEKKSKIESLLEKKKPKSK